jgi:hypothetical protein
VVQPPIPDSLRQVTSLTKSVGAVTHETVAGTAEPIQLEGTCHCQKPTGMPAILGVWVKV